jgi:hypothetical protein
VNIAFVNEFAFLSFEQIVQHSAMVFDNRGATRGSRRNVVRL